MAALHSLQVLVERRALDIVLDFRAGDGGPYNFPTELTCRCFAGSAAVERTGDPTQPGLERIVITQTWRVACSSLQVVSRQSSASVRSVCPSLDRGDQRAAGAGLGRPGGTDAGANTAPFSAEHVCSEVTDESRQKPKLICVPIRDC